MLDAGRAGEPAVHTARAGRGARSGGRPEDAAGELRATVLEPVRASDFPATLVCRLTRVQGLIAAPAATARRRRGGCGRRSRVGERHARAAVRADRITAVLADLGRPLVGLVDPEHEHARVLADIAAPNHGDEGSHHAIVH